MRLSQQSGKIFFFSPALCLILVFLGACEKKYEDLDLSMYQYQDTKNLVRFVYDASRLVEKEGLNSLEHFRSSRDLYNATDYYLYIYDLEWNNLYHAGMEDLEGRNLREVTDKDGKKITRLISIALADKNNPHAWVHYFWWEPGKFFPVPKSSCNFKVETPLGTELLVGGGMNYPHEEKEFIRIIVDSAADLIKKKGKEALGEIADPNLQYNYRDVRVFAFYPNGDLLISPAINSSFSQVDLLEYADESGHKPFVNALKKLETTDAVLEVFTTKNRYKRELVKKCLYMRKILLNGKEIYLAAITDLPEPPY